MSTIRAVVVYIEADEPNDPNIQSAADRYVSQICKYAKASVTEQGMRCLAMESVIVPASKEDAVCKKT